MPEKTSTALSGTVIVYDPLLSVTVPWLVPFTWTDTPARDSPLLPVTFPVMRMSWSFAVAEMTTTRLFCRILKVRSVLEKSRVSAS
jgi:hypothetical protein